jgi:hypothetical protein
MWFYSPLLMNPKIVLIMLFAVSFLAPKLSAGTDYESDGKQSDRLAETGDATAEFRLGNFYQNGWGVPVNEQVAAIHACHALLFSFVESSSIATVPAELLVHFQFQPAILPLPAVKCLNGDSGVPAGSQGGLSLCCLHFDRCCLHSALGYRPPEEFEEKSGQRNAEAGVAASKVCLFDE